MTRGVSVAAVTAGVLAAIGAYLLYPIFAFTLMSDRQTSGQVTNIIVIQDGSAGDAISISVDAPSIGEGTPKLVIEEENLATRSTPNALTYIGYETHVGGFRFEYEPIRCQLDEVSGADAGDTMTGTTSPDEPLARAYQQGSLTALPNSSGELTWFQFPQAFESFRIICDLPGRYAFQQDNLANWRINLPGIESYAAGGAERGTRSYSVAKDPSDFIQQASQQPSVTYQHSYEWWERHFERLAPQGLWLTVSAPALQQENAYRLFLAGALLGLAASFIVSGVLGLLSPQPR